MKRFALIAGLTLALAPAAQAAEPAPADTQNAARYCKALKAASGSAESFRAAVDTVVAGNVTTKNAYGKCVSFYAKDEAKEAARSEKQAKSSCKAEREAATTPEQKQAFAAKYGAKNDNSAYGKCVSQSAKAEKDEADAKDAQRVNAAKQCKAARGTTEESKAAFAKQYKNFGKCVSEKAKAQA